MDRNPDQIFQGDARFSVVHPIAEFRDPSDVWILFDGPQGQMVLSLYHWD